MADKQLINSAESCVRECLDGFWRLHPHLSVDVARGVVVDSGCCDSERVALISGGGSGHEPFPAGYVGKGMLTASVSGPIFTCPPSKHVLHAIRLVAGKSSGILLLVGNYTGDVLNFGLAAEAAVGEGASVEIVVVGDDVGGEVRGGCGKAGKRGMCGLVLVMKVAGYLSERGENLEALKKWCLDTVRCTASMGLCVSACSKPGVGPLFDLEKGEVEVGVGVHGEAGIARTKMLSAREAVQMLLRFILAALKVAEGDQVVALINNLGSLSCMEQWLLAGELETQLSQRRIQVVKLYAGRFFTSLNMAGVQVSILKLCPETRETILAALDHPTTAFSWPRALASPPSNPLLTPLPLQPQPTSTGPRLSNGEAQLLANAFNKISFHLLREENRLNHLDSACGDGDCGTTFSRVAVLLEARAPHWDFSRPQPLFSDLCSQVEESVGGTSGALYGLFFKGISQELVNHQEANALVTSRCWRAGLEAVKKYSLARPGDRTMLDAMEPACRAFERSLQEEDTSSGEAFRKAVTAALEGCQKTKGMKALAGRASYTDSAQQKDVDAGAYAVTVWLSAILQALEERQGHANRDRVFKEKPHLGHLIQGLTVHPCTAFLVRLRLGKRMSSFWR